LPLDTHTQGTLARQTHLQLLSPSPPIRYFPLRLCTEVCSIQPGLRNPWCSLSFTVSHLPLQSLLEVFLQVFCSFMASYFLLKGVFGW
ncbi:unnamed protein product, partial [Hymenolepis diminuta]